MSRSLAKQVPASAAAYPSTAFMPKVILHAYAQVPGEFHPINGIQRGFLLANQQAEPYDSGALKGLLHGKAGTAAEVNSFMAEKGFPEVQLSAAVVHGIAAAFHLHMDWKNPGTKTNLEIDDIVYQGAKLPLARVGVAMNTSTGKPIFLLPTNKPAWHVVLTEVADHQYLGDPISLTTLADEVLLMSERAQANAWDYLAFPAAKLGVNVDMSMFIGLSKGSFLTDEAKKYVRFEIDHLGAKAEAGVAFGTRSISQPPVYRIEKPYIAILVEAGTGAVKPVFTAYVGPDSWLKVNR